MIQKNTIIHDRYKIIRQLNTDNFENIYLVEDIKLPGNPHFLLKHFPSINAEPLLLRNVVLQHSLKHKILDFFKEKDGFYLIYKKKDPETQGINFLPKSFAISYNNHLLHRLSFFVLVQKNIWRQGNRAIALASGGAFLGGFLAQVPGAIIGAIGGAILGFLARVDEVN